MPATTEIVTLNMIAGSDVGDPDNQASHILNESCDTLMQQDGAQQVQFGLQHESPDYLQLFINWDSLGHHQAFRDADSYKPFRKTFDSMYNGPPNVIHVDLKPEGGLAAAQSAPVTEVATFYFDGGPPDNAAEGVEKCLNALKAEGHNLMGWAYGTTYETIERDGVKGKGAVLTIGWENVEAHMEARKGQAFKDNVDSLRNGAKGIEMHHVQFMNYQVGSFKGGE